MRKYGDTYIISINSIQDISIIDNEEEREEFEEIIDEEIMEGQEQIEMWCKEYKADYDLLENHRCIVTTNTIYTNEMLLGTLKSIEDNLLKETSISVEVVENE